MKNICEIFCSKLKTTYLCITFSESNLRERTKSRKSNRAFSSAGSEHLPYKQRVGGSNPSTPTELKSCLTAK